MKETRNRRLAVALVLLFSFGTALAEVALTNIAHIRNGGVAWGVAVSGHYAYLAMKVEVPCSLS